MSSTFGRSVRSFRPNRIRNSRVVAYRNGRPTTCLRPAILIEVALEQRGEHAGRVHAANLGDLRRRDRLLVGDDRQRLERLHRQLLRRPLVEQSPDPLVQLGARDDLVAAGDLDELQAARGARSRPSAPPAPPRRPPSARVSSSLNSVFGVSGSGDAKMSASTIAFRSSSAGWPWVAGPGVAASAPATGLSCPASCASLDVNGHGRCPLVRRPARQSDSRRAGRPRALVDADRAERPAWNTRTSFRRIISSSARNVTIRSARDDTSSNRSSKPHASVSDSRASSCVDPRLDRDLLGGSTHLRPLLARSSTPRNAASRLKRSTSSSGSYSSPAMAATRPSGRIHCALAQRLALVQQLGRRLVLLVLEQPAHERLARILLGVVLGGIRARQQHPRLDVDERRRHHEELARHVEVQLLHQRPGTARYCAVMSAIGMS